MKDIENWTATPDKRSKLLNTLRRLAEQPNGNTDVETAHIKADRALLDFIGDDEIDEAFDAIRKWYA